MTEFIPNRFMMKTKHSHETYIVERINFEKCIVWYGESLIGHSSWGYMSYSVEQIEKFVKTGGWLILECDNLHEYKYQGRRVWKTT